MLIRSYPLWGSPQAGGSDPNRIDGYCLETDATLKPPFDLPSLPMPRYPKSSLIPQA